MIPGIAPPSKTANGPPSRGRAWLPAPEVWLVLRRALGHPRLAVGYLVLATIGSALAAGKFLLLEQLVQRATTAPSTVGPWLAATLGVWLAGETVFYLAAAWGLRLERRVSVALVREALEGLVDPTLVDEGTCRPETAVHLVRSGIKHAGQSLRALLAAITQALLLCGTLAVAACLSPPLALVCSVFLVLAVVRTRRHLAEQRAGAREAFHGEQQWQAGLYRLFQALPQVRLAGTGTPYAARLLATVERRKLGERRVLAGQRRIGLDVQLLSAVDSLVLLLVGASLAYSGNLTLPTLAAMLLVERSLLGACRGMLLQWSLAHQPCEVVAALLRPAAEARRQQRPGVPPPSPIRSITLQDVRLAWMPPAATAWNATFEAGKLHGLIARTKGQAERLLVALASGGVPASGNIRINGVDLPDIDRSQWRSEVALLTWPPLLEEATLAENLRLADPSADNARLLDAIRASGLEADLARYESLGGLAAPLGPRGVRLSFGQQQRLLIARACLRRPAVLLLDDPLRGLDAVSVTQVMQTLRTLAQQAVVVLATGNRQAWSQCDVLWGLDETAGLEPVVWTGKKLLPSCDVQDDRNSAAA